MFRPKPRVPVIDWSNPLSRGIVFDLPLYEGVGRTPMELVTKNKGTFAGSPEPTWKESLSGKSLDFVGTAAGGGAVYHTPSPRGRGLNKYSIEFVGSWRSAGANNAGTFFRTTDNTNSGLRLSIFDGSADSIAIQPRFSTTSGLFRTLAGQMSANTRYHIIINYDGSDVANVPSVYVNNKNMTVSTTTPPVGTIDTTSDSQFITGNINQIGNVGNRTWDGPIGLIRVRNRLIKQEEVKKLFVDPWQIYKKRLSRKLFDNLTAAVVQFITYRPPWRS